MYKKKIILDPVYKNMYGRYKISYIFSIIQDIACLGAEDIGCGLDYVRKHDLMWVILKQRLQILKPLENYDKLTFYTYPGNNIKFIYTRYIYATDDKGDVILRYYSHWAILNHNNRHITTPDNNGVIPKVESRKDQLNTFMDINKDNDLTLMYQKKAKYSDIDMNNHLNNIKYVDMSLDCLDSSYYQNKSVKDIQLEYYKEIHENDTVDIYMADNTNDKFIVIGKVNNNVNYSCIILF